MILTPRRATWKRWLRLSSTRYSILRGLEYECLEGLILRGRTLDIGGGQKSSYYHLMQIEGVVESVNIDRLIVPTVLADLNCPLAIVSGAYDNVISLNTFEHIQDDTLAIAEAIRVLRIGGHFHFVVPFLFRVHGSPNDFHRHSALWWVSFLESLGLSSESTVVEPLVWSPVSTAFSLVEFTAWRWLLKKLIMLWTVITHVRWWGCERLSEESIGRRYAAYALGYYVHGTKQRCCSL